MQSCFTCCSIQDHLKPNVSRYVGCLRNIISIISQRRAELNYQHACVQTGARLIALGWSPRCLCPCFASSQLTTWRFIAGKVQLSLQLQTFILQAAIPHCAVHWRGQNKPAAHLAMWGRRRWWAICRFWCIALCVFLAHFPLKVIVFYHPHRGDAHIPCYLWFLLNAQTLLCTTLISASLSVLPSWKLAGKAKAGTHTMQSHFHFPVENGNTPCVSPGRRQFHRCNLLSFVMLILWGETQISSEITYLDT